MSTTLENDLLNLRRKNILLVEKRKELQAKSNISAADRGHVDRLSKDINKNRCEERRLRGLIRRLKD